MLRTLSSSASAPSPSLFAHERASTSLTDLDIVRKIVEREGCLEALAQLLTTHARAVQRDSSMSAMATLTAAPMVLQSLLDQLRSVSVQILESIAQWKQLHGSHLTFQWRSINYPLKMVRDLDFLSLHGSSIATLSAFHGLRLQRNPFLSPLHLDHAALKEESPEMACRLALFVGNVDMKRIFAVSKALLTEEQPTDVEPQPLEETATTTMRLHWSHRPMKRALSPSASSLPLPLQQSSDPRDAMAYDVELAKELVFQHEHELGAMKEELAVAQKKLLKDVTMAPDKKRQLTTRIAALNHEVKLRTGDLFHRRNELQRKEAVLRMDKKRLERANTFTNVLKQQHQQCASPSLSAMSDEPVQKHFSAMETFKAALQADELRRHELIQQFASHAKLQAAVSVTKRKLQSLSRHSPQYTASEKQPRPDSSKSRHPTTTCSNSTVASMSSAEVEAFVNALDVGDELPLYGSKLRAKGIDGHLLAQATDSDLEELGVSIRLHRLKILHAVQQTQ